ncbi:MAG: hypothetical protein VW124_24220 [Paracoccaceae bacterium]|jgi:multisubunit Na+/H+ antiporter MnhE subunit
MTNFIRLSLILLFRLSLWCLVTASFHSNNIFIGLVVCLLIPFGDFRKLKLSPLILEILLTLRLPFDMIKESVQLILILDPLDDFTEESLSRRAKNGSMYSKFLDLFRMTFTPMTLVTHLEESETWRVHNVISASTPDSHQEVN